MKKLSLGHWTTLSRHACSTLTLKCPTIRALKRYLQTLCGLPRFRQRLILSDGTLLDDNDALVTAEAQLVLLAFCQTTEVEEAGLKYAAKKGETEMIENLLPKATRSRFGLSATFVARMCFWPPGSRSIVAGS